MYEIECVNFRNQEIFIVNGYHIHSKYNPYKEAENLYNKFKKGYLNIVFGHGKGYFIDYLLQRKVDTNEVLVIEPILEFERYNTMNYETLYSTDIKVIEEAIESKTQYFSKKINVIKLANYDQIFPKLYLDILKAVKNVQNINLINYNTVYQLSNQWQENTIFNIATTYKSKSLLELEKKYSCPIIIASGGPSLTKQLSKVKKIRKNIILIAAGSTFNSLIENNIVPDYIVSIDGSLNNYERHFKDSYFGTAELIYSSTSHYLIQKNFPNGMYSFLDTREVEQQNFYNDFLKKSLPILEGGGSVANFCLSIARYISDGPIALIGQDLAYTNNQSHALGNRNFENIDLETLGEEVFLVEDFFGGTVYTNYSFYSMKESFEAIITKIDNNSLVYNCTEGGIRFRNIQQLNFDIFITNFIVSKNEVRKIEYIPLEVDFNLLITQLKELLTRYESIILKLNNCLDLLNNNESKHGFDENVLIDLDLIDKEIKDLILNSLLQRASDPITLDVMHKFKAKQDETDLQAFKRVYDQNVELYSRMRFMVSAVRDDTKTLLNDLIGEV